ncbi:MAG: methylmalonyl Co-A mutase-associated GTPase MeaB [Saprospiraceae bacterium]|nr:methylmalonyl Co-A mutase-associated GTPase MeaB [Saprospiraceae bacterium]
MENNPPKKNSRLHISKGKTVKSNINKAFKPKQVEQLSLQEFINGIRSSNRVVLSQAITLIESRQEKHQILAQKIIEKCLPYSGNSLRIGLTGTPGVGKSTFINGFGKVILNNGENLAVLAIDPSSQTTKGSILGDKTRMEELTIEPKVFIRPSPANDSLGGVARKTRETIILCEAAGYNNIIIETVGVGQSETAVHSMVDFFLLLLLPNSGDELQGIKRGIMEMADLIAINKADGEGIEAAKLTSKQYKNALHLLPAKHSGWTAKAEICSALNNTGLDKIWSSIKNYHKTTIDNGFFAQNRKQQAKYWLEESVSQQLKTLFFQNPEIKKEYTKIEKNVIEGDLSPFTAGKLLLELFKKQTD